jgi:hypothetical protein
MEALVRDTVVHEVGPTTSGWTTSGSRSWKDGAD